MYDDISDAVGIIPAKNHEMNMHIRQWYDMYTDSASWLNDRIESLRIPSAVASEFSRLVLTEFSSKISDEFLDGEYRSFTRKLPNIVETACALGGVVFKPYVSGGKIYTDIVNPCDFILVSYDSDIIFSAIFPESFVSGKNVFTRLEYHCYDNIKNTHTVNNFCFCSESPHTLGKSCSLKSVPKWAELKECQIIENVKYPLFCYFKMPFANNIDLKSPLGISVYSKSVDLIKQADRHWERIMWEFESSERAIDAAEDIFRMKNGKPELPKGRERMFRTYNIGVDESKPFIETFSPAIRDASLFNGLNGILRRIEFNCGLEYGTISDVSAVQKTAEEIKSSRLRSFDSVNCIQQNLHNALEHLVYCYAFYASFFGLAECSPESAMLTCTFGDGVKEDIDKEYQRRMQMVKCGLLSPEKFISWYFGCPESQAADYINSKI